MASLQTLTDTDAITAYTWQLTKSCKLCHENKIKCDLSGAGPCSKCAESRVVCERRTRRPYSARRRREKSSSTILLDPAAAWQENGQTDVGHTRAFAEAVVNPRQQEGKDNSDHLFVGDQQGIGSILDAMAPTRGNHVQHLLGESLARYARKLLKPRLIHISTDLVSDRRLTAS